MVPGDKLVSTSFNGSDVLCQAFITAKGKKLLLINKCNKEVQIYLPAEFKNSVSQYVDVSTNENPPAYLKLTDNTIVIRPFSVNVLQLN